MNTTAAGVIARQRKNEVEELNERLRKINLSLRQQVCSDAAFLLGLGQSSTNNCSQQAQSAHATAAVQARVSTMYAPGLTYAPRGRDERPHQEPQPSGSFLEGQNFSWPPPVGPAHLLHCPAKVWRNALG